MCLPVAAALAVASAVVAVGGTMAKGIGEAQQYRAQAQVNDNNTRLANEQARDAIDNTNLEAQRQGRETAALKGRQQATMAANGVDLNFGSAVDVQKDTAMIAAEDRSQIYKAGNERTKGFEINAFNYRATAAMDRAKAKGAITNAIFSSLSTALGSASQVKGMRRPSGSGSNAYGVSGSDGIY